MQKQNELSSDAYLYGSAIATRIDCNQDYQEDAIQCHVLDHSQRLPALAILFVLSQPSVDI